MEENYKVNMYFLNSPPETRIYQDKNGSGDITYTRLEEKRLKASINNSSPIYPNECLNSARINIAFNKEKLTEVIENMKLEIRLYFSNGEDLMEYNFGENIKSFE